MPECQPFFWFFNEVNPLFRLISMVLTFSLGCILFITGCVYLNNGQISHEWAMLMLLTSLVLGGFSISCICYIFVDCFGDALDRPNTSITPNTPNTPFTYNTYNRSNYM